MGGVKAEPGSPPKPSTIHGAGHPAKGKQRMMEEQDEKQVPFEMADWVHDPALWHKMGASAANGAGLGDPVKTIEVRV